MKTILLPPLNKPSTHGVQSSQSSNIISSKYPYTTTASHYSCNSMDTTDGRSSNLAAGSMMYDHRYNGASSSLKPLSTPLNPSQSSNIISMKHHDVTGPNQYSGYSMYSANVRSSNITTGSMMYDHRYRLKDICSWISVLLIFSSIVLLLFSLFLFF